MALGFRLHALFELLQRYSRVFSHAWRHREQMEPPKRLTHEAQFLPAALALQETPVSPLPRLSMWLIMLFAALATAWAWFGQIDVVATAQGKIVPNDRTKVIQSLETARINRIFVSDGQSIKAGEVLIELDTTSSGADRERLQGDLQAAELQIAQNQALLTFLSGKKLPKLSPIDSISAEDLAAAQSQLTGQAEEYSAKRQRIEAELARREAELGSLQQGIRKLEQILPITRQRVQDLKALVDQNFIARHGYLEREQVRIEQEADLATQKSQLKEAQAALQEARSQIQELTASTRRATLDQLAQAQQQAAGLRQEYLKADSRNKLMQLTSPVDGTVQQLAIHTVGGVVTPAQALMVIVPRDNPLEVEAMIENKDIGFVKPGQTAEIKIETFQYTKYGTLDATLSSISHDAINDEKRGLIYSSRVKMHQSSLMIDGTEVRLSPGMAVSVEIKTGKRRVIEYFLAPLLRHANESLKER